MHSEFLEALVQELGSVYWIDELPDWIPCMDSGLLRDLPTMAVKRKWLRKAKAEIKRRHFPKT